MKRLLILFAVIILAQSCANAACVGRKCTMDNIMKGWMGKNLDEIIDVWGYPDKQKNIAGRKLYLWSQGTYRVENALGTRTTDFCTRMIEVDDSKTIIGTKWKGNGCPFTSIKTARKWVNPNK